MTILKEKNRARESSIELLRIISMLMIVMCHFAAHGGFTFAPTELSVSRLWWCFIVMGGNLGVNVFVIISGYFLVNNKDRTFNLIRILKFWCQIFVYSIAIYLIFCIMSNQKIELLSLVKALFPITYKAWWFASAYFVLYIIHPFLNMFLQKLSQKEYQALLVTEIILWCIIPTFTLTDFQCNDLLWFVTLYSIAGYIRLFGFNPRYTKKHYLGFFLLFTILIYLSSISLIALGLKIPRAASLFLTFYKKQSVLPLLAAISLFMVFLKSSIGCIKWINLVASATFGVYLIHDNKFIRPFLWLDVFKNAQYQNSSLIIPYSLGVVVIIYVACTLIDLFRQFFIERPFLLIANRCLEKIQKPFIIVIDAAKRIVFGRNE